MGNRSCNKTRLTEEIINLSASQYWHEAKLEWRLETIYEADALDPETCLCGHFPIIEVCIIVNTKNDNEAIVGNVCVNKFLGLPSDSMFRSLKRVKKDIQKSLSIETIEYAYNKKWIKEKDRVFYLDTHKKRNLTEKQMQWRIDINQRIISGSTSKYSRMEP
jgi:hypothetical protein